MTNKKPEIGYQSREYARAIPGVIALIATDRLLGCRLYAYWVFEIDLFDEAQIEGTLMSNPVTIHGPYEFYEDAVGVVDQLFNYS